MSERSPNKHNLGDLLDMHTFMRPAGSQTEAKFIAKYVSSIPGAYKDEHGNWHVVVGDAQVIWSCHTDTVHRTPGIQTLNYDPDSGLLKLSKRAKAHGSNCLGADDTAGVWLCREMISRAVEGHYIFHYGEECGGYGSTALAYSDEKMLKQYKMAIALDRGGTGDVVTHQWGEQTASNIFALSLAIALAEADPELDYMPHPGVYTDTAEYAGIISECSNLSVGYDHQHSQREVLDTRHLFKLLEGLCKIDLSVVDVDRDPEEHFSNTYSNRYWGYGNTTGYEYLEWEDEESKGDPIKVFKEGLEYEEYLPNWYRYEKEDLLEKFDSDKSIYLDPAFDAVQRQLKKQLKDRQGWK